jgi:transposase
MKKAVKQVAGIDVAQKELVVTFGSLFDDFTIDLFAYKVFKNTENGIKLLVEWVNKLKSADLDVNFVMEATGVYHQKFAYYLDEKGYKLSIILPNKISNYIRTLDIKTITDKSCSQAIARFGLERKLDFWKRPDSAYNQLQQLTRERDQVVHERSMVKNQIHAETTEAEPHLRSLERMQMRIEFLNSQEKDIKNDIAKIVNLNPKIKEIVNRVSTIPGVGKLTAVIVLAETNGFELIRNKRQLTSYAGFDVKEKQSGTSVKGKPKISKRGNKNLRKALHLPSLSSVKWDENFKAIDAGLVAKHGIKMKALIAIQRKVLELIYVLYKNKTEYDKGYAIKNSVQMQII